jgi:hypothetical protein
MRSSHLPRLSRLLAGCAAVAVVFVVTATPAQAQPPTANTINYGVKPADEREYLHVNLAAGQTSVRPVSVSNFSAQPVDLTIYPADATINAQGGFALAEREAVARHVGSWIHLPIGRVHLAGNASTVIGFPITVPAETTPGDYAGGVVVQRVEPGTATTIQNGFAVQLDIVERVGARVYLHVAGEAKPGLKVGKLSWRQAGRAITFSLPVTNTGNVRLQPTTLLHVQGFNLPTGPITTSRVEDLLPGSTVTVTGRLARPPAFGTGEATATVDDGVGHRTAVVTALSLVPVLPIAGLLAGFSLLLLALWKFIGFLRRVRAALRLAREVGRTA